jgi:circadian clock protein KaiB
VAGNTPNSIRALKTLNNILEEEFQGVYALKVIDVLKNPQLAEEDKILATPTLAKDSAAHQCAKLSAIFLTGNGY